MRPFKVAGAVAVFFAAAIVLTGCAHQDAAGLAQKACTHVERSLSLEQRAATAEAGVARNLRSRALAQLSEALPLAAVAAGKDTQYQALDATLSEATRVPESNLVYALSAQCAGVRGSR
jgi:hypothetical protein